MSRGILSVLVLALALTLSGCGDSRDAIMQDTMSEMKSMVAIFKDVKDEASAKAAGDKLKAVAENMKKIKARADKIGKPSADEEKALETKYKAQMEPVMKDFMGEMFRIGMDPKLSGPVQDAMKDLQDSMPR